MAEYLLRDSLVKGLLDSYQTDTAPFLTRAIPFTNPADLPVIAGIKDLLFPCYRGLYEITQDKEKLKAKMAGTGNLLFCSIMYNLDAVNGCAPAEVVSKANNAVDILFTELPAVRELLKKDAEAALKGDPAAKTYVEIIRVYPGFEAIAIQRVAHILYELGIPSYPRELTEYAHSKTGIDLHPGAKIGQYFFIDHGTGVVLGETTEVGDWVRLYQDVTLGVLHFEKDGSTLKKGYKRHPTLGSHVIVGAGAKILGPANIADHVNIGANCWVAEDVESYTTVYIAEHPMHAKIKK